MYTTSWEDNMEHHNGYRQIYEELRRRIENGTYKPGDLLPPERLLQEEWNVERTTIRRALTLLVRDGLILKRAGIGSVVTSSMPFSHSEQAVPQHDNSSQLLGMVVANGGGRSAKALRTHNFIGPVSNAFSYLGLEQGFQVFTTVTTYPTADIGLLDLLKACRGIIWADNVPQKMLEEARRRQIPSVLMSQRLRGFRSVVIDNEDGMRQIVAHLHGLGHRNIAYIGGDSMFYNSIERRKAFIAAMNACGLPAREELISTFGWSEQEAARMAEIILMKHPEVTAICAANDRMADAVIRTLRARGTRIPEDISVTGFGAADFSALLPIPPTTIKTDYMHFARELFNALLLEMENPWQNPSTVFVETELLPRASTGSVSPYALR
ncbi:MAG: GntR family transcriptional regulator [Ruminococcaceae bacterium]|nr:GntR family transcriptional regulator [Oscillospiraceae bacterium]